MVRTLHLQKGIVVQDVANPFHPDKLLIHREKVAALARGEMIAPQTIEVDLTDGACNQSCVYCCFSSGEGKKMIKIDSQTLHKALCEAYALGPHHEKHPRQARAFFMVRVGGL